MKQHKRPVITATRETRCCSGKEIQRLTNNVYQHSTQAHQSLYSTTMSTSHGTGKAMPNFQKLLLTSKYIKSQDHFKRRCQSTMLAVQKCTARIMVDDDKHVLHICKLIYKITHRINGHESTYIRAQLFTYARNYMSIYTIYCIHIY